MSDFQIEVLSRSRTVDETNEQDQMLADFEDSAVLVSELLLAATARAEPTTDAYALGACLTHYVVVQKLLASASSFDNTAKAVLRILDEKPAEEAAAEIRQMLQNERQNVLGGARSIRKRAFGALRKMYQETPVNMEIWAHLLAHLDGEVLPVFDAATAYPPGAEAPETPEEAP